MAALDAMTIRLHLRAIRVLEVVEDLPESLVVAVVAIANVIRCSACGHKTRSVHATRKVRVADLAVSGRPAHAGLAPPTVPLQALPHDDDRDPSVLRRPHDQAPGPGGGGRRQGHDRRRRGPSSPPVLAPGDAPGAGRGRAVGPGPSPSAVPGAAGRREVDAQGPGPVLHHPHRRRPGPGHRRAQGPLGRRAGRLPRSSEPILASGRVRGRHRHGRVLPDRRAPAPAPRPPRGRPLPRCSGLRQGAGDGPPRRPAQPPRRAARRRGLPGPVPVDEAPGPPQRRGDGPPGRPLRRPSRARRRVGPGAAVPRDLLRRERRATPSGRWSGSPTPTWRRASTWDRPSPRSAAGGSSRSTSTRPAGPPTAPRRG